MKKTILNKYYQVLALDEIKTEFSTITKILDQKKSNFHGINEVYSSTIKKDVIRAWKKHTQMICNIFVIKGSVKFIFFEDKFELYEEVIFKEKKKNILVIKPNVWFGFKGLEKENIIINFSNIMHDDNEVIQKKYDETSKVF